MSKNNIIKFRDLSDGTPEKVKTTINDLQDALIAGQVNDVIIAWRTISTDKRVNYFLTDYIWWSKFDRMASLGMLDYIKAKILNFLKAQDGGK